MKQYTSMELLTYMCEQRCQGAGGNDICDALSRSGYSHFSLSERDGTDGLCLMPYSRRKALRDQRVLQGIIAIFLCWTFLGPGVPPLLGNKFEVKLGPQEPGYLPTTFLY